MQLRVIAPARLHFGLLQIDPRQPNCYGGIGLMLNEPALIVCGSLAEDDDEPVLFAESVAQTSRNELGTKAQAATNQALNAICPETTQHIRFRIEASPRLHTGLGTGTQLACCIATLVRALTVGQARWDQKILGGTPTSSWPVKELWSDGKDSPSTPHHRLAYASGRGKRSHIGLEGFLSGGWIYDHGVCSSHEPKAADPNCSRVERLEFPSQWRVLLFGNDLDQGLSGEKEQASFDMSQNLENDIPAQMIDLATNLISPAIRHADYLTFAQAIRSYNQLAGKLFLNSNPDPITANTMKNLGTVLEKFDIKAYGQSSWGPTMWAVLPNENEVNNLQDSLNRALHDSGLDHIQIHPVQVCATGAILQQVP